MTASHTVNQQGAYARLEDDEPVEPFTVWCKKKMRNPVYVILLLALVAALVALAALHPWDPPPKEQYSVKTETNYFGYQQFKLPPYLLRFTGAVRLRTNDTADVGMKMTLDPWLPEDATVFYCPNEPYVMTSTNDSHSILTLTNAHKTGDCLMTFIDAFVAELQPLLKDLLPYPFLAPIVEDILDGVLKVTVNENLDFDRYNNSIHMRMVIEGLIKVDVRAAANALTPTPTKSPTLPPSNTSTPTKSPTLPPSNATTPAPTPADEGTAHLTVISPVAAVAHPQGEYEGSDNFVKVDGKMDFLSNDDTFSITVTVNAERVSFTCKNEPYSIGSSGALKLDTQSTNCLQEELTKNDIHINSISWIKASNMITIEGKYKGLVSLKVEMSHKD